MIDFEYCECGCHQHVCSIAGNNFCVARNDDGMLILGEGHDARRHQIARLRSYEEIRALIRARLEPTYLELKALYDLPAEARGL